VIFSKQVQQRLSACLAHQFVPPVKDLDFVFEYLRFQYWQLCGELMPWSTYPHDPQKGVQRKRALLLSLKNTNTIMAQWQLEKKK